MGGSVNGLMVGRVYVGGSVNAVASERGMVTFCRADGCIDVRIDGRMSKLVNENKCVYFQMIHPDSSWSARRS